MIIEDQIRDEKLQCDINTDAAKLINMNTLLVKKYCHLLNSK